jgi:hypothetical protein
MNFSDVATDGPYLRTHLQFLGLLTLSVLVVSVVSVKVWANARANAKARRRTEWIVSKDPRTGEPICDHKQFLR